MSSAGAADGGVADVILTAHRELAMTHPLDHIVIYASDIAKSVRFYEVLLGMLGFESTREHVFAREGFAFDLRPSEPKGAPRGRTQPGVDHIGFGAPDRAAVDRIAERMRSAGYAETRIIEFDDGAYAFFAADPDGVRIEVTAGG